MSKCNRSFYRIRKVHTVSEKQVHRSTRFFLTPSSPYAAKQLCGNVLEARASLSKHYEERYEYHNDLIEPIAMNTTYCENTSAHYRFLLFVSLQCLCSSVLISDNLIPSINTKCSFKIFNSLRKYSYANQPDAIWKLSCLLITGCISLDGITCDEVLVLLMSLPHGCRIWLFLTLKSQTDGILLQEFLQETRNHSSFSDGSPVPDHHTATSMFNCSCDLCLKYSLSSSPDVRGC